MVFKMFQKSSPFGWFRRDRHACLVVGLSGCGKTSLTLLLKYRRHLTTCISVEKNNYKLDFISPDASIVDLPGHPKLRSLLNERLLMGVRMVVVVVDSDSTILFSQTREHSEFLNDLFLRLIRHPSISVLILCNKQDVPLALKKEKIKQILEKGMDEVRSVGSREVSLLDDDGLAEDRFLGVGGKAFEFEDLVNSVVWKECSCALNQNINDVREWLQDEYSKS